MKSTSARLARAITWKSSKQSYLTALLLADPDLVDDCMRAYAYFRWADDNIDIHLQDAGERAVFIDRQKKLIEILYRGDRPEDLSEEERMLADLISHDRAPESMLSSFIHNFMSVIEMDNTRRGRPSSRNDLDRYTATLSVAVMDGIQYFIGNCVKYKKSPERSLAVQGAHITHMLRDMLTDIDNGLVNIPVETIREYGIDVTDPQNEGFRKWVREQVMLAKEAFDQGRTYIDSLEVLRCKLAGVWYCVRFECVLKAIEKEDYRLRSTYCERRSWKIWLEMIYLGFATTFQHALRRANLIQPSLHFSR